MNEKNIHDFGEMLQIRDLATECYLHLIYLLFFNQKYTKIFII